MILIQTEDFVVSFALCNPIKLFFSIGGGRIPVGGNPWVPSPSLVIPVWSGCVSTVFWKFMMKIFMQEILESTNHFSTNVSLLMHNIHTRL